MDTQASTIQIFDQLTRLEREVQRLKVDAYFSLPKKIQREMVAPYAEQAIVNAVQSTRDAIWREQYADKMADLP